jgi:Putative metal-binding motif
MRRLVAIAFAVVLGSAAPAHAHEMRPSWGNAIIDDRPFHDPSGALLPATQAFPRGQINDPVTDGWGVRMTVSAHNASGAPVFDYTVTARNSTYIGFDRLLDVGPNEISYLLYTLCRNDNVCHPSHAINRPPPTPQPAPDADRDGVSPPADCDDTNSAVRPGAPEMPGNGRDDDCVGGDGYARVVASVVNNWRVNARGAKVTRLVVRDAPATATVTVRCLGKRCRMRPASVSVTAKGTARLTRLVRRRLRPGSVLEVRITAPNMIGKVVRYPVRRGRAIPQSRRLCLPPGATKPGKC